MFEAKLTITAPGLEAALNNLAAAIAGSTANPIPGAVSRAAPAVPMQTPAAPAQPMAAPAPAAPMTGPATAPSNPAGPTPAGGSANPVPTAAPAAPMAGPTSAYPSNGLPGPAPQPATPTGFPAGAPLPTGSGPQYTVDQIMTAGATLMDAGKAGELMNLLASFNVPAVTALKPEQLGAFATALRQLGAQI